MRAVEEGAKAKGSDIPSLRADGPAAPPKRPKKQKPKRRRPKKGPFFTKRRVLRWGGGLLVIGALAAVAFNWSRIRTETLTRADTLRIAVIEHPEFAVTDLEISGHIQLTVIQIARIIGIEPGTRAISSLRFDARKARDALLANPWIERASVSIDPSGVMKIFIEERVPVAIWRNDDGFFLIDTKGRAIVPVAGADARLDLPLLIGPDANDAVADAQALLKACPASVLPRIAALVRRGARRWDLITDSGLVVKLPADDPLSALRRFDDRNLEEKVVPYAVTGIDLRLPDDPPVIRLEPGASAIRAELLETLRTTYQ